MTTVQLAYLCHTYFLCGSNRHRNSTLYVDTILFCSPSLLYYFRSSELNFSFFISWSAKDWIQHSWMGGWCRFDFLNFQKNWGIHYSTAYREPAGIKKAELGNKRVVQCTQLLCRQFRWKHLLHPWVPLRNSCTLSIRTSEERSHILFWNVTNLLHMQKGEREKNNSIWWNKISFMKNKFESLPRWIAQV